MLKMKSIISVQVNGKDFDLHCEPNASLTDAIEANTQINAFLLGRIEQNRLAQKASEQETKSE